MTVIRAAHYAETVDALIHDPQVLDMLLGLHTQFGSFEAIIENVTDGDDSDPHLPTFEFMMGANREYDKRPGVVDNKHIGAVAEALIEMARRLSRP